VSGHDHHWHLHAAFEQDVFGYLEWKVVIVQILVGTPYNTYRQRSTCVLAPLPQGLRIACSPGPVTQPVKPIM
jgi:hypothetical protein